MGRGNSKVVPQATRVTTPTTPPTPQEVAKGNILPGGGVAYDDFKNMTDDEKADVVEKALGVGLPAFLDDSGIQKLAYFTGMKEKPTVVADDALDKMSGTELYRTVNNAYNRRTDIGYTSKDIAKQITDGDFTMYSDSGGSAHGKAIYFADNFGGSAAYGNGRSDDLMIRAKITSGNVISERSLDTQFRNALGRGDKLAVACSKADWSSQKNLYALAKGYDVVQAGNGYNMVLKRSALTVSSKTINPKGLTRWQ